MGAREESKKIIQQTWPDTMVSDASTELTEAEIADLMNRAPRCDKWLVARAQNEPCSLWSTVTLSQKIATSLHHAMPNYSVETLFESRNNLSNTARVSISELYPLKPIAFRWTGTSSAHDQVFFGNPGRSEQTIWAKSHEAWRLIGSTSNTESALLFTSPSIPNRRKNQPSIVLRSILDISVTTHCHAYPHLLSRHGRKSWSQYDV